MRFGCLLTILALWAGGAGAQDLEQVLAIQQVMEQAIAQAEPSIACVLVSRSSAYGKLGYDYAKDGVLGGFDVKKLEAYKDEYLALRRKLDLSDPGHVPEGFGSGIVVDPAGLVLTNFHVVQDATKIFVRLPGGKGSYANIHAADTRADLAILKLLNPKVLPLKALAIGDASKLKRGQWVLSLANPYAAGFRDGQPSASWGILSNIRRRVAASWKEEERAAKPLSHFGTLLQIDARLNLGCSGGALLNLQGECVGITSSLAALEGGETPGGFAIPLDVGMMRIVEVLKRGEEVEYGFLGIGLPNPEQIPADSRGVPITRVIPGSPAKQSGLIGLSDLDATDVLLAVNGLKIYEADDLLVALSSHLAGAKVRLDVRKSGGETTQVDVRLAKLLVPTKRIVTSLGKRPFVRGIRVDDTSLLVQARSARKEIPEGVLVSQVDANSSMAAKLGGGEVITHVNGRKVTHPAGFYDAVAEAQGPIELTVQYLNSPKAVQVMLR